METRIEQNERKGSAIAAENNSRAGQMTYSLAGDGLIIIDHTEVESVHSGKAVGKLLLMAIVEMARKDNKKIMPLCPFAKAQFDKRSDIHDVLY